MKKAIKEMQQFIETFSGLKEEDFTSKEIFEQFGSTIDEIGSQLRFIEHLHEEMVNEHEFEVENLREKIREMR